MKHKIFIVPIIVFNIAISLNGCYTQVMTPQEVVQVHREKGSTQSDISSSLNYNQNCFTCHSREELEDRYVEWKYYGITTAHNGIVVDPMSWDGPYTSPIYEPDPYGWYNPVPVQPWWLPTAVGVKTSVPATTTENSGSRPRTEGSTRDGRSERTRSEQIPASTQQPQSGNTTTNTPTPSSPPAVTVSKQPEQTPPPSNTNTNDRTKSDSGSSSTNRPRTEGSTRDGGGRSR